MLREKKLLRSVISALYKFERRFSVASVSRIGKLKSSSSIVGFSSVANREFGN
jgi:hypothetical protein